MTRTTFAIAIALMSCSASLPALAAGEPQSDGRYTMSPSGDGFVRLDKESGTMDYCARQGSEWRCEPMAEGQNALRDEAARKQKEIDDLKAEKKHLEEMLGLGEGGTGPDGAPLPSPPPGPSLKVPDEKDVDQMFDYLEGMIKKFKERLQRLEKDKDQGEPL